VVGTRLSSLSHASGEAIDYEDEIFVRSLGCPKTDFYPIYHAPLWAHSCVICMMRPSSAGWILPNVAALSVLVVDDHAIFADALQARLSREPDLGPVRVAYGIAEARAKVARTRPAVVVLDLLLSDGESGLDVAEAIRETSPQTKIIILTAVESVGDVVTGLMRGVRAWLPKTVEVGHLVRVIRGVHAGEAWLAPDLLGRVLTDLVADASPDPLDGLTTRERQVLQCMVDGLTRAEIAHRLHLSVNTVRTHTQNIIAKLGAHSTLESVALALRKGLRASSDKVGVAH
jgi:two-component system NarL family response regulator